MDPLMDNAESSDRAFGSPVFYLDTDDADYFAFHDLELDGTTNQSVNSASTTSAVDPFDEMMVDSAAAVSLASRHFLQPTVLPEPFSKNASPTSSNMTPVLTHDEDDIEDDEDDERYMAEHFDFDSAATPLHRLRGRRAGLNADGAGDGSTSGITIRSSDSDSSLSSVKRDTFSYPPSPKSMSSQHSTPFSGKSVSQAPTSSKLGRADRKSQQPRNGMPLTVRDITPPQQSPGHSPPSPNIANNDFDESVYVKPHDWVPPSMMPDFDPLDWVRDEAPFRLSVSTDTLKSRVETQIKALLTFVPAPTQLYMHLPATTIAKPRQQLRKTFTSDPKTLELDAIVVCDHNRYKYINVCPGCMNRERKRASRKKLPSVDDTHWLESQDNRGIMFNCAELMEISEANPSNAASDAFNSKTQALGGDVKHVEIPMRIPCYCRHHSEKTGFRVYFVVKDHTGNVVARTYTEPIMITDDHKTTNANARRKTATGTASSAQLASSANVSDNSESPTNEYGFAECANPRKRKMSPSIGRTQSSSVLSATTAAQQQQQQSQPQRGLANGMARPRQHSATSIPTTSNPEPLYRAYDESNFNTRSHSVESFGFPAYSSSNPLHVHQQLQAQPGQQSSGVSPLSHPSPVLSNASSPESTVSGTFSRRTSKYSTASAVASVQSPRERTSNAGIECPVLQRLIPTEGPIRGGIEVTLLGTSFHQGLTVMFGDQPAVKTHIWNDSTIVAILPPAATPGPVVVRLRSISEISSDNLKLFTYIDDTDRQLMELALQVIGLKMTGRLEDARQIAMRIVSQTGSGGDNGSGQNNVMAATTASGSNGLEKTLLKCLDLVDYNESPHKVQWHLHNSARQTMLHLAAQLGFQRLVAALLARGASYRLKDNSGYTPLHFAAMRGHREIVLRLLNSGADPLARSVLGYTVIDVSCNDEISALMTSYIAEPMDYGAHSRTRQHSDGIHHVSSRQNIYSRQNSDFPDWPSSSGPSSPAASISDIEYLDSLDDDDSPPDIGRSRFDEDQDEAPLSMEGLRRTRLAMSAAPAETTKKAEKKSKPWSRKKLFGRSWQKPKPTVLDTQGSSKQKQLQLRLAEYLASLHEQTLNRMHPNWHAANHFMHDAFTSFSSFKPALANIANQQSRRANEIMQSALENSWFGDYFSTTGTSGNKNDNSAPPSYDEIYPEASASSAFAQPAASSDTKDGAIRSATLQDEESKLREQEILLKFWQNKKKKQMRNDLMLFAFWLPVLCVLLAWGAMSFFGIHVLDYVPIPHKLVEFVVERQKLSIADSNRALQAVGAN
ncbi:hypothetical protein V1525DRAFT_398152 [Lipomyces kononenkoae]|uniref:Uncharacterized protein n=1 Tax=Lipomyces kononenkoae TaxID=34357 RepID=A0ACC3T6B3_LIPKO